MVIMELQKEYYTELHNLVNNNQLLSNFIKGDGSELTETQLNVYLQSG
jgi:hypothetical protein